MADRTLWAHLLSRRNKALNSAGFDQVMISEGPSRESQTVQLICGFASQCDSVESFHTAPEVNVETVVWKTTSKPLLFADIYYPLDHLLSSADRHPIGKFESFVPFCQIPRLEDMLTSKQRCFSTVADT